MDGSVYSSYYGHLLKPLVLFFLSAETVLKMIFQQKKIPDYFPVEMVLLKINAAWDNFTNWGFLDVKFAICYHFIVF